MMQLVQLCDPLSGTIVGEVQVVDVKTYQHPEHPTMQYACLKYADGRVQDRVWIACKTIRQLAAE